MKPTAVVGAILSLHLFFNLFFFFLSCYDRKDKKFWVSKGARFLALASLFYKEIIGR
jgi:hypothetical protein